MSVCTRTGLFLLLIFTSASALADDFFRLPSYVSLQGGLGKDHYQDASVNAGFSLPGNWQLEVGADKTVTQASDGTSDNIETQGFRVGGGSDPLNLVSFRVLGESWNMNDVEAKGGRLGVVYAPGLWTFTLEYIAQQIRFTNLPLLLQRDQEETVKDSGFSLRVSTLAVKDWNFYFGGQGHSYDHDLSRLYEIPALLLNRVPVNVLTTLTGLSKNDAYLGATYMFRRWDVGFEAGRSIAIVDNIRTRRFGLSGMFYLNKAWSFGLNVMTFRPEASEESSDPTHSASALVTFKW